MPAKPLRPCNKMGCSELTRNSYCDKHRHSAVEQNKERHKYYDKYRRNKKHDRFYHSSAWIKLRDYVRIRDNGVCQQCLNEKRITIGKPVDHIVPIAVDWDKRLDEDNVWLLCQACHTKKTLADVKNYRLR